MSALDDAAPSSAIAAPTVAARLLRHPTDWLVAVLVSWVIPLELLGIRATYFTSLAFWVVPVLLLLPRRTTRPTRADGGGARCG